MNLSHVQTNGYGIWKIRSFTRHLMLTYMFGLHIPCMFNLRWFWWLATGWEPSPTLPHICASGHQKVSILRVESSIPLKQFCWKTGDLLQASKFSGGFLYLGDGHGVCWMKLVVKHLRWIVVFLELFAEVRLSDDDLPLFFWFQLQLEHWLLLLMTS